MTARVTIPSDEIAIFCERWGVLTLALFGSVLRDDFKPDSDIDVLAEFKQEMHHTLLDLARMEEELQAILGREVDLVERADIVQSRNYIRRKAILESVETIYAA